jgi:competence protein ComEC
MAGRSQQAVCECWFLDVGQGTSNVILLGEKRAIVIDCGPRGSQQTIQLLTRQHIETLEALIISHNDSDHDYNVSPVLNQYRKATKRVFFLQDRTVGNTMPKTFAVLKCAPEGDFPDPERLETKAGTATELFSHNGVVLSVLYPDLMENLDGQTAGRPNRASAILRLSCGGRRIVFSGDATINAWECLARKFPEPKPLLCDVMTVPHHGGNISASRGQEAACQHRLYTNLIRPEFGIVSAGTFNQYGHPEARTIKALRQAGVKVLCTQMTGRCIGDLEVVRPLRTTLAGPSRSTRSRNVTDSGKSKNVACFGSMVAEISETRVKISNLDRYEQDMKVLSGLKGFNPLCRPTA